MRRRGREGCLALLLVLTVAPLLGCDGDGDQLTLGLGGAGNAGSGGSGVGGDVTNVLEDAKLGDPGLASLQRISFGPGGVLLLGDGIGDKVVAIETGDTDAGSRSANLFDEVSNINARIDAVVGDGVGGSDIQIQDVAVNPLSWRVYLAVTRYTTGEAALVWVGGDGAVHQVDLSQVIYASVSVPAGGATGSWITDVEWVGDHVIVSSIQQQLWSGQLLIIDTPFAHEAAAAVTSTRIYHRSHQQWENDIPVDRFLPFQRLGVAYIGAAFAGTPMVRYRVEDFDAGSSHAVGATAFDFGDGRSVRDFFRYESGGIEYLVAAVNNLAFDGLTGAARVKLSLLTQSSANDVEAPIVFDFNGNSTHPDVSRLYVLDAAERLAKVNDELVVVVRGTTLKVVELP